MNAFWRIMKYVWPQWPRLVIIVIAVLVIAVLFAGSFATVIPLLKVMMGRESIHRWVDRVVCDWRYDINFYVPEAIDLDNENTIDNANNILITNVKTDKTAYEAGLKREDKIIAIIPLYDNTQKRITGRGNILKELSNAPADSEIQIVIHRPSQSAGQPTDSQQTLTLSTGQMDDILKFKIDTAKWVVSFVPEKQGANTKKQAVFWIIIGMGIITIIRCIARFYQQYLADKVVQVSIAKLREDTFAHAMFMPVGFFVKQGSSDTISRLIVDISGTGTGIKILLGKALREPAKAVACLAWAMTINWQLVLIFLGCAPATLGLASILGKKIKKYTKRTLASNAEMLGKLTGTIGALRVVKVYNQQENELQAYKKINRKLLRQSLNAVRIDAATGPIMEVIGMFAGSAALLVGVQWITNQSNGMEPEHFFGLLILLGTSAESIRKASDVVNKIQQANAAAERVFAVTDQPEEYENHDAAEIKTLQYDIEFRDLVFTYPGSSKPVLNGVNLTVKKGNNVAIVGSNGSGKTTLVNLLPRFYNPDSGAIFIDGQNILDGTLKSLRDQIAMVTQNVVTFNDTIANNIAYGKPGASMEEIIDAAKRSYAHEFIEPLPNGYNTVIGEQGAGLSGGQLQRIVIARAILKNPPILIFDEATSQVDAKSEAMIHDAIEEIMKNRTSFVIAHRFSTVVSADTIVVMDEGRIIDQGVHSELMERCDLYRSLYENQILNS